MLIAARRAPAKRLAAPQWVCRDRRNGLLLHASCASSSSDCNGSSTGAATPAPALRIGVVGLGAIGTICFAKLGCLAIAQSNHIPKRDAASSSAHATATRVPVIAVDAFVKPRHFDTLFGDAPDNAQQRPVVALHEKVSSEGAAETTTQIAQRIPFTLETAGRLAVSRDTANVRIRVLAPEDDSSTNGEDEQLDVVLVAVKAYDSASVVTNLQQEHARLFKKDALFVLLQNGLGELPDLNDARARNEDKNEPTSQSAAGASWRFAHGVTYIGGRVISFANVLVSGFDAAKTCIAPISASTSVGAGDEADDDEQLVNKMELLGEAMAAAGFQWERLTADEMKAMQWKKLVVNAGINPIASIFNAPNKSVGACEWSRGSVEAVVSEAFDVAIKEQVALNCTKKELVSEVLQVAANTGNNVCSMVADLRKGSRTEIEAITGRIVALGHLHNVPTPANALLFQLVKALEAQQTHANTQPAGLMSS